MKNRTGGIEAINVITNNMPVSLAIFWGLTWGFLSLMVNYGRLPADVVVASPMLVQRHISLLPPSKGRGRLEER